MGYYPLGTWLTVCELENCPVEISWIFPWTNVISHGYVKLPEGKSDGYHLKQWLAMRIEVDTLFGEASSRKIKCRLIIFISVLLLLVLLRLLCHYYHYIKYPTWGRIGDTAYSTCKLKSFWTASNHVRQWFSYILICPDACFWLVRADVYFEPCMEKYQKMPQYRNTIWYCGPYRHKSTKESAYSKNWVMMIVGVKFRFAT